MNCATSFLDKDTIPQKLSHTNFLIYNAFQGVVVSVIWLEPRCRMKVSNCKAPRWR